MEWISVNERLPENGKRVLVAISDGYIDIDIYEEGLKDNNLWRDIYREDVEYWMPLPEAPLKNR